MVDIAKLAIEVDASQATAAAKQLQVLGTEAARTEKSAALFRDATGRVRDELGRFVASASIAGQEVMDFETAVSKGIPAAMRQAGMGAQKATGSFRMAGNGVQMMGYQIQDIAVQLGAGTSPFIVLSQQGSQIASLFGPGGAVIGALLAVSGAIAGPLVASLMRSTENTDKMSEAIRALREELNAVTEQQTIVALEKETKQLQKGLEMLSSPVRDVRQEGEDLLETITGVSAGFLSNSELIVASQVRLRENNRLIAQQKELIEETNAARQQEFGPDADLFYQAQWEAEKKLAQEALAADSLRVQSRASALKAIEAIEAQQMSQQERLTDNYLTQQNQIAAALANEFENIERSLMDGVIATQTAEDMKVAAVEQANDLKIASDKNYEDQKRQLQMMSAASQVSAAGDLFGNLAQIAAAGGKESFDEYKRFAQAQAGINAAAAVLNVLASPLAAMNPILAGALATSYGALAAVQIAQIEQQEYTPARALGGQVQAGTSYLVGERGPELVTMGANGYVTPNDKLQGSNQTVVLQISTGVSQTVRAEMAAMMPGIVKMIGQATGGRRR